MDGLLRRFGKWTDGDMGWGFKDHPLAGNSLSIDLLRPDNFPSFGLVHVIHMANY